MDVAESQESRRDVNQLILIKRAREESEEETVKVKREVEGTGQRTISRKGQGKVLRPSDSTIT